MTLKINGSTAGSVSIDAPADTSPTGTDVTLTLPTSAGSSGQYLQTNGSGTLSWQTVEGLPDAIDVNASAPADSVNIDASGRFLVGTDTSIVGKQSQERTLQVAKANASTSQGVGIYHFHSGGQSPNLELGLSKNNTLGSHTAVSSGDNCGSIIWSGSAGSEFEQLGSIAGVCDGTPSGTSMPGRLGFFTTASGSVSPTERVRILNNGAVVMTTDTSWTQHESAKLTVRNTSNYTIACKRTGTGGEGQIAFKNGNGLVGNISTSGSSTSYNTSSDYRLKENVVDLDGAITRVKQLAPKRFNFIADETDTLVDGFLAHEAQAVVPEAVTGTHNEVDDEDNPVYQGIDQAKLVPLLTAALQEAIGKIEALETANASLEARLTALEGGAA